MNPIVDLVSGAVEGLGQAVAKATAAFKADPTKVAEYTAQIEQATLNFQSSVISSVNQTMQAEAKSEHWMQWAWRPTFGFTASGILVNNYILLPYFAKLGIVAIVIPMEVWLMIMAVLGVAAWTRGLEKLK
jgi:hypothetical protein